VLQPHLLFCSALQCATATFTVLQCPSVCYSHISVVHSPTDASMNRHIVG